MFGARFSVWGARSADEANANVRCTVQRLGRPLGGRGERKCSVQGLAFWSARLADEATANVRCKV